MLKLKTYNKANANDVGVAPWTTSSPKTYSNPNFKIQALTSDPKGITLIALIITIIVMLILVGVTVNIALNGGLFNKAKQATTQTQYEIDKEQLQIAVWNSYDNEGNLNLETLDNNLPDGFTKENDVYVSKNRNLFVIHDLKINDASIWSSNTDGSITDGNVTLQIGDYVNYAPDEINLTSESQIIKDLKEWSGYTGSEYNTETQIKQSKLNWEILDVKDGKLRLISETPSDFEIYLRSYNGYNNVVYLLDELCKELYSNKSFGNAQNLKIEDIEDKINKNKYDYTVNFGVVSEFTDESRRKYPEIFLKEKNGWVYDDAENPVGSELLDSSEQDELIKQTTVKTAGNKIKIKRTYWTKNMQESDWIMPIYHNLFIEKSNTPYWLSSRAMAYGGSSTNGYADFFTLCVRNNGYIGYAYSYRSTGGDFGSQIFSIRPVVTLSEDVQIGNKIGNVWQIK